MMIRNQSYEYKGRACIMDADMTIFAELLATLITKYSDKIDLESLPDPPSPETPQRLTD